MVQGALFGTFCSRYQIVPSKATFLQEMGCPYRGGTAHMSRFEQMSLVFKFEKRKIHMKHW